MKQKRISIILSILSCMFLIQCAGHKPIELAWLAMDAGEDAGEDAGQEDELKGLCRPCYSNNDCKDIRGACVANLETGEYFCSRNCSEEPCPKGFFCMYNIWDLDELKQCMPIRSDIPCENNVYDLPY
jgi:hypothetical protein